MIIIFTLFIFYLKAIIMTFAHIFLTKISIIYIEHLVNMKASIIIDTLKE